MNQLLEIDHQKLEIAVQILIAFAYNPEIDLSSKEWSRIAAQNAEWVIKECLEYPSLESVTKFDTNKKKD